MKEALSDFFPAKREDTEAAEEAAEVEELEVKQRRYSNSRKRESHKNQIKAVNVPVCELGEDTNVAAVLVLQTCVA